jgi:hypothetical protein
VWDLSIASCKDHVLFLLTFLRLPESFYVADEHTAGGGRFSFAWTLKDYV